MKFRKSVRKILIVLASLLVILQLAGFMVASAGEKDSLTEVVYESTPEVYRLSVKDSDLYLESGGNSDLVSVIAVWYARIIQVFWDFIGNINAGNTDFTALMLAASAALVVGKGRGREKTQQKELAFGFMNSFIPTDEQRVILSAFKAGKNLKIHAFAGTGKTSTLVYLANQTDKRGLYCAFNRRIVNECRGKMPPNVDIRTAHSIAYKWAKDQYKNSKLIVSPAYNNIRWEIDIPKTFGNISDRKVVKFILRIIDKFCNSSDEDFSAKHIQWDDPACMLGRDEDVLKDMKNISWTRHLAFGNG